MLQLKAHQLLKMLLVISIVSSCVTGAPKSINNLKLFNYHSELKINCRLVKDNDYPKLDGNIQMFDSEGREFECADYRSKGNKIVPNVEIDRLYKWINLLYNQCSKWRKNAKEITSHLEIIQSMP